MTAELSAIVIASAPIAAGVLFGFYIGRFGGRKEGEKRGVRITDERINAVTNMVARRWVNRPFQPLQHYKNKAHWMELARRECHQLLADDLCKTFAIETPSREVTND